MTQISSTSCKMGFIYVFFSPLLLLFFIPSPRHHPRTGWCETSQLHPSSAPAPQLVAPGVPQPPMDSFRMELWGQGTPLGLTRGILRDVFPPGFEQEALPANAGMQVLAKGFPESLYPNRKVISQSVLVLFDMLSSSFLLCGVK